MTLFHPLRIRILQKKGNLPLQLAIMSDWHNVAFTFSPKFLMFRTVANARSKVFKAVSLQSIIDAAIDLKASMDRYLCVRSLSILSVTSSRLSADEFGVKFVNTDVSQIRSCPVNFNGARRVDS